MQDFIGQTIGDYFLLEPIEEGGVATVYRAKSQRTGQLVAFKILKPESLTTEQLSRRFVQETEIMVGLNHPHIIDVIDSGSHNKQPYMVLEYASNGSLAEHTDNLSLHDIANILTQVASALDYAHVRNVIHRDIKLENILLDGKGNIRLIDFGLAKNPNTKELETGTGIILGTPYYLSPEQCLFKPVDGRSDVYSLGVTMFYLLTGKFPFDGRMPAQIIMQHVHDPAPLVNTIKPELSQAIADVINKALAKSPEERYQSAGEFATAFSQAIGTKTELHPLGVWLSSLPPLVIFVAIIMIVMVIAFGFVSILSTLPA